MIAAWLWLWWQPSPMPCRIDARVVWSSPARPNALILVCFEGECGDGAPAYTSSGGIAVVPTYGGSVCEECAGTIHYGCAYGNPGDYTVRVSAPDGTSTDVQVRLYLGPGGI